MAAVSALPYHLDHDAHTHELGACMILHTYGTNGRRIPPLSALQDVHCSSRTAGGAIYCDIIVEVVGQIDLIEVQQSKKCAINMIVMYAPQHY